VSFDEITRSVVDVSVAAAAAVAVAVAVSIETAGAADAADENFQNS